MFLCGNGFCLHVKAETSPVQSMGRLTFFSSQMSRHPCTDLSKAERFFYVVIASQTETFYKGRLFCFCSEKQNGTVYILTDTAAESFYQELQKQPAGLSAFLLPAGWKQSHDI